MINKLISKAFRVVGYNLVKSKTATSMANHQMLPKDDSFNILPILIDRLLPSFSNPFFIQVGANDGVRLDPIRKSVLKHKMKGILIEPLPDIFAQLTENYKGQEYLHFEAAALSDTDGNATLFRVHPEAPVGDWAHGIASFNKSHVIKHIKHDVSDFDRFIIEEKVPTISVQTLLAKYQLTDVFLLQIDTEGFDYEIIKMFFNSGVFPPIINFEHAHIKPSERIECGQLLTKFGYKFIFIAGDTLALHDKALGFLG